ncbi:MAG: YIP1 family protein [Anaerolineae bacterium]
MLTDRIIGAFTFRSGVYKEVEEDTTFTTTAWLLVIVIGFLNQLGSHASRNLINWLGGAVVGTIFVVLGFAVGAFVVNWVGRTVFNADVTFDELVRTLGLAYVWNIVGVIGALAAFSSALSCLLTPAVVIAGIAGFIAWLVAAKEALDLEWVQTIVTVILGWVAMAIITMVVAGIVLTALGLGGLAVGGLTSLIR